MHKPSIVAPGGSLEKAMIALDFGADAVYVGASKFSLRKSADNLSFNELSFLCNYAHNESKKVYLALNIFPLERDIQPLTQFLQDISNIPLDALIISDIGLCKLAKQYTSIPIHVSTQASIMNASSAKLWVDMGVKRIVMARECSIKDSFSIKTSLDIETELFIHGAMCSSFSGKCTISNVTSGRDSNRGGCVQSCRHSYQLSNGDDLHVMNSKDLQGLEHIPDYFKFKVDAVKIEGRMKSALYVANTVQQYRKAIDMYAESPDDFLTHYHALSENLNNVSNRGFTSGSLVHSAAKSSISYDWNGYTQSMQFMGIVKAHSNKQSLIHVKNPIQSGSTLIQLSPHQSPKTTSSVQCYSISGEELPRLTANECGWINQSIPVNSLLIQG